jgi:RNA polymerase sigma-70 factor (ECF subfamily)
VRRRNREAADMLVSTYYDEIYVYVCRQTGNRELALDLTQDIFISVLQSIDGYDRKKAAFRTWLYRIATNKIIDCRRKSTRVFLPIEDFELPDDRDLIMRTENQAFLSEIEEYISTLDNDTQKIFRLRVYGEHTFPEIAAITNQPEATVKTRYYRLTSRLRKEFVL